jgi:hypothetical protein
MSTGVPVPATPYRMSIIWMAGIKVNATFVSAAPDFSSPRWRVAHSGQQQDLSSLGSN